MTQSNWTAQSNDTKWLKICLENHYTFSKPENQQKFAIKSNTRDTENKSAAASAAAKSLQLCPTLWDPIDGSPPGSPIPGILQARTLEGVAISFSNAWKWKVKVKSLSHVWLLVTPWTAAHQAPPSMGFSKQEYWSRLPFPSPMHEREKWKWSRSVVPDS